LRRVVVVAVSLLEHRESLFVLVSESCHLTLVGRAHVRVFSSGVGSHVLFKLGAREGDDLR
jgi:hypothetical protein